MKLLLLEEITNRKKKPPPDKLSVTDEVGEEEEEQEEIGEDHSGQITNTTHMNTLLVTPFQGSHTVRLEMSFWVMLRSCSSQQLEKQSSTRRPLKVTCLN